MAKENKPRKKPTRSERKALRERQEESRRVAQESTQTTEKKKDENAKKVVKQPGPVGEYLRGVRSELRAVTWPSTKERRNASVAVFAALIFFGVLIYALDTGIVPLLGWYVSL